MLENKKKEYCSILNLITKLTNKYFEVVLQQTKSS